MEWKFYHTIPGFDRSGLGFAADVDYQINESPTKVFVGLYDGITDKVKSGLNGIAQIGHVWNVCEQGNSNNWGAHYYLFGDNGDLTGMQNGRLGYTGCIIYISKSEANRLIKASWDLISAQESLGSSLEKCILSLERAKRRK